MSQQIITDQSVYYDGYDLRGRTNTLAIQVASELQDNTVLGQGTRSRIGGLKTVAAQLEGFVEPDAVDAALFAGVGLADKLFTYGVGGDAVGDVAYFFLGTEGEISLGAEVGGLLQLSAGAETASGDLYRGKIALNSRAAGLTTSGNGTGLQLGAISADQRLYAALHVWNVGTGSFTAKIQSDNASNFASATDQITFSAFSAVGSELKSVAGAITDDWWRVSYTISGAAPNFKALLALAIK